MERGDLVLGLLRALDEPGHLSAVAPMLRCTGGSPEVREASFDASERPWLATEGLVSLAETVPAPLCASLVAGIRSLVARGYPACFVYAFDEVWEVGERIRARVSALVGERYVVAPDIWAWEIAPGRRGWPPHRGMAAPTFDRARPEVVNTWVALSDATAERSCMHFVPLDDDAHYPSAMDRVDAPLETVRALPVLAGTALAWNANVLHWGGPCARRAAGPRVSASFTLVRADVPSPLGTPVDPARLGYRDRMELLADQLLTYGEGQPDVSADVLAWGRTLCAMRSLGVRKEG